MDNSEVDDSSVLTGDDVIMDFNVNPISPITSSSHQWSVQQRDSTRMSSWGGHLFDSPGTSPCQGPQNQVNKK